MFLYRHTLATLHFNENVKLESKKTKQGEAYVKVSYLKFKLGEEVVREVAVPPSYGKLRAKIYSMAKVYSMYGI